MWESQLLPKMGSTLNFAVVLQHSAGIVLQANFHTAATAIIYYSEVPNNQLSTPSRLKTVLSLPAGLLGTLEYNLFLSKD